MHKIAKYINNIKYECIDKAAYAYSTNLINDREYL